MNDDIVLEIKCFNKDFINEVINNKDIKFGLNYTVLDSEIKNGIMQINKVELNSIGLIKD